MSQENVERFHRIFDEWYRAHRVGPGLLADDVEWVQSARRRRARDAEGNR